MDGCGCCYCDGGRGMTTMVEHLLGENECSSSKLDIKKCPEYQGLPIPTTM